jgi:FtsP/CotA-like multicopper oxidase with cupredoxin domain
VVARRLRAALQALVGLAVLAGVCEGQGPAGTRPCDPPTPLGPSHDLYCIELIPAPGVRGASGRVELAFPSGPSTVSVTADGRTRFRPEITLIGLPDTAHGPYVAWAATPQMDSLINLGAVKNGTVALREIDFEKFIVLITAERSARVRAPTGRVVLRGQSPSTRLFPPDLLEFSIGGMGRGVAPQADDHEHAASEWPMVPMPPGLTMLPAEMALRPNVVPFLPQADSAAPPPWARPRQILKVADGDTVRLEAGMVSRTLNGRTHTMYAYNGQYPGPLIEAQRGTEIVVQFTSALPESSSIHWHGIRLDNAFDGVEAVGRAFTYRVRFPDAGIYWYHPHVREDVQQDLGLYGNILVRTTYGRANREEVLLVDDLLVGDSGLIPFGKDTPTHALMGRFGNLFLVNGEPGYRLAVRRGEVVRFYLTNASSTRTLNLSFAGARMKVVAADAGPFERETWVESVVIAPAERYVVHVKFDRPGNVAFVNQVRALDHLFGRFFSQVDTLGIVTASPRRVSQDLSAAFAALRRLPPPLAAVDTFLSRPPDKALVLTLETQGLPFVTERLMQLDSIYFAPVEWGGTMPMMNWASTGQQVHWILKDPATGRSNMDIDWTVPRGAPVKIRLVNERRAFHGMQHPIHLHGQRFLVLAVNGVPNDNLAWKDTVLVPAGSVVDILLDASNPGHWMLHCHIAEHLSAGMMMHFNVN